MKSMKLIFYSLFAAIAMTAAVPFTEDEDKRSQLTSSDNDHQETASLRGMSRFLAQQNLVVAKYFTCDKFPRICRQKRNRGTPDCCKKKCVNVKTDPLNCGMCGKKCKHTYICCKGKCVNAYSDKKNCGGCKKKCKKGKVCVYGMCNYGS